MTREEALELARESRAAQGLPPTIEDPAVLDRVAMLLRTPTPVTFQRRAS